MTHRKFIVEGEQLLSAIKSALEDNIQNRTIIIVLGIE